MVQITAANFADRATADGGQYLHRTRLKRPWCDTGGAAGAQSVKVRRGVFRYTNSTAGDLIVRSQIAQSRSSWSTTIRWRKPTTPARALSLASASTRRPGRLGSSC